MQKLLSHLSHLMNHREKVDGDGFSELAGKILADCPGVGWELGLMPDRPGFDLLSLSVKDSPSFWREFEAMPLGLKNGADWKIEAGIPPKDWELFFEAAFGDGLLEVEGKDWLWSTGGAEDFKALVFSPPEHGFESVPDENLLELAEIIAIGELGEVNYLTCINRLSVSRSPEKLKDWHALKQLRTEFVKINPTCPHADWIGRNQHY